MTDYLLDANVFIQAKNLHYGFDFCPAFWDWLVEQNRVGKVASIEKVADELHAALMSLRPGPKLGAMASFSGRIARLCLRCAPSAIGRAATGISQPPSPPSCRLPTIGLSRTRWPTTAPL